ncbi:MAG: nucleotide exchange factor GrpE [Oscillospiraceae bacterium]
MSSKKKPPNPAEEQDITDTSTETVLEAEVVADDNNTAENDRQALIKEAQRLAEELCTEKEKYLRLMAEYDNYRKRSQKERENIYADVRADTILKLLPVYDNLERAIKQETADEAYSRGVEMIMTQLKEIFSNLGISEIAANPGDTFDPLVHNAVMHIENEALGENVIAEEFQKGFMLGDKVIRFSVVTVAN